MRRRAVLRSLGAGVAALGSGCVGGAGEVIVSVQRDVTVEPGRAWTREDIPDLSASGGGIEYIVRADEPFDVYFFADEDAFERYDAYIKGREPDETPAGHPEFSQTALPKDGSDLYEATTSDGGARESVEATGPYYFAVDHSSYRMETRVDEYDEPLTAFVDLKVVRRRSPV
ncbi:hypothetical protein [Haloarcula litorea]|uniref:hypothetical protein n=1 Tax=Haloarcula litorea TaxID=3032579 RepID=UPI0023E886E0|nr:hypothetical protein [Halomicroarcula sp. GDY20]